LLVIARSELAMLGNIDARRAREIVYREGPAASRRLALALSSVFPERRSEAVLLRETAVSWQRPRLPITGADLIARGIEPGPAIGALLAEVESWWIAADFPEREQVLRHLETLIRAQRGA